MADEADLVPSGLQAETRCVCAGHVFRLLGSTTKHTAHHDSTSHTLRNIAKHHANIMEHSTTYHTHEIIVQNFITHTNTHLRAEYNSAQDQRTQTRHALYPPVQQRHDERPAHSPPPQQQIPQTHGGQLVLTRLWHRWWSLVIIEGIIHNKKICSSIRSDSR